ncbi:MAG: D-alanyl-D-alanine carboxypeptidase, partial [Pseudomonadota bacterium]|nr:D-alanyl-D-alanine carboxypeptidase [Pseudomonadota bacterium]
MQLRHNVLLGLAAAILVIPAGFPVDTLAATHYRHHRHHRRHAQVSVPYSALVVDADDGHILYEKNARGIRYPASLTKMMTLYLTFDAIKHDKLRMDQRIYVSAKAASQPQTNIGLERGERLPVKKAIESIVVRSANDSAVV